MASSVCFHCWGAVLSFAALLLLNGALWLARRHKAATSGSCRAQLTAEIAYLRREATKLNTPSTYAKCAKYQRLANAKEKELNELAAGPTIPGMAERLVMVCGAVKMLVHLLTALTFWDAPAIAQVTPRSVAIPLGRLLAFPKGAELAAFGGVAVAPWLMMVDSATAAMARAAFPPRPPPSGAVDGEKLAREAEASGRSRAWAAASS